MTRSFLTLAGLLSAALTVQADATIRQSIDWKFGAAFPPATADVALKQAGQSPSQEIMVQAKGSRCRVPNGRIEAITDSSKGTVILLDPAAKKFATLPLADYRNSIAAQSAPAPPSAASQTLSLNVYGPQKTGQTSTIEGIRTEEYLMTIAVASGPTGSASTRMEARMWMAAPEELIRMPELQELAGCPPAQTDLLHGLQSILAPLPGFADRLGSAIQSLERISGLPPMKIHFGVFAPATMGVLQLQSPQAAPPSTQAPLLEGDVNLQEFSTNSIPDTVFAIPKNFNQAPAADLLDELSSARHR